MQTLHRLCRLLSLRNRLFNASWPRQRLLQPGRFNISQAFLPQSPLFLLVFLNLRSQPSLRLLQQWRQIRALHLACGQGNRRQLARHRQTLQSLFPQLFSLLLQNPFGIFRLSQQLILGLLSPLQRSLALLQISLCHSLSRQPGRAGVLSGTANRAGLARYQRLSQNARPAALQNPLLLLILLLQPLIFTPGRRKIILLVLQLNFLLIIARPDLAQQLFHIRRQIGQPAALTLPFRQLHRRLLQLLRR